MDDDLPSTSLDIPQFPEEGDSIQSNITKEEKHFDMSESKFNCSTCVEFRTTSNAFLLPCI